MPGLEIFTQGGYTMIGILIASVAALTEIVFCFLTLRKKIVLPKALTELAVDSENQDYEASADLCRKEGGPFADILLAAINSRELDLQEAESIIESEGRRALHILSRGVLVLEVVAAIAPLLGLLGTVLGMQEAFSAIAEAGIKQMGSLPEGISKALITTITGLIVAIPSFIFYSYFQRRVEDLIIEMERHAMQMLTRIRRNSAAD
ncbi:MAG: MotA/TolQ/ExbB proton channel family protein [Planctomycetota bacterium]|jgi:biopolymer transport protein ExbB